MADAKFHFSTASKILASFAATIILVAIGIGMSLGSVSRIEKASIVRERASSVLNSTNTLMISLLDAETSVRGYVITNDPVFLEPYLAVSERFSLTFNQLYDTSPDALIHQQLDLLIPMIEAKFAYFDLIIKLRLADDVEGIKENLNGSQGELLMDSIRSGLIHVALTQQQVLDAYESDFQSGMKRLFSVIVCSSLFTILCVVVYAVLLYQETQRRLKNRIYLETKHLLDTEQELTARLKETNSILQANEEKFSITLNSIGDAVLTTDFNGNISGLNPVAEKLVGWKLEEALGKPVSQVFHIINQETRKSVAIPVMDALSKGTVQGLANHTILISRDNSECAIADSCAPIRNWDNEIIGAVLVFRNVTEEYAAQQAIRDSAALIQTILNTVEDGIITIQARGGIIETVNPAVEHMFGYTALELAGQKLSSMIPELDNDQWNGSLEYYSASDADRAVGIGREVLGKRKDGSTFPIEIALSEMFLRGQKFFTGILRDISNRKQAEEILLNEGALQRAIFNSENFSSIATDANGVIQIFNVGAERMLGYTACEVMNKITPADISDPNEVIIRAQTLTEELSTPIQPGFEALVFKASRGIEDIYELTYIRKDGSRFPAVVSVTALRDAQNEIIGYLLIGTDNTVRNQIETERMQLSEALQDKNDELQIAKYVAEKANLAKSNFLSSMSHELRTPLSAILGFAQLIESGTPELTSTQKRSIEQILKAGWYLLELINEILDLALIESGKLSLSMEAVALSEVLHECQEMIEVQAQKRGISVTFSQFMNPSFVLADRTRLKQVLLNLLSNAIKYNTLNGSVKVKCILNHGDRIRISVTDTGAGLTPDQIAQLFEPFNRLGKEGSAEEGTGIGLVVCKRLIELMGGIICVDSTPGKGSTFWIEMNLMKDDLTAVGKTEQEPKLAAHNDDPNHIRTLLYVEDNPANLMLVEDLIERRGNIRLISARDGISGIEKAITGQPDVILMDINLPGISGIDALKLLSEDIKTEHIPVVALSANAIPRDIEKGIEAGFFRYLTKPIKVKEFMETIDLAFKFAKEKK